MKKPKLDKAKSNKNKSTLKRKDTIMFKKPDYKKVVFVPDIHAPFHDPQAVKASLSFIKWWKPQEVIFLGDAIDFYAISRFDKDPQRRLQLQSEIDATVEILTQFKAAAPLAKFTFLRGNHEHRLQKYLWTKAAELSGLRDLTVPHLLKLNELGIKYINDGKIVLQSTIIKHGNVVRKFSAYSSRGEFETCGISGVSGHTHRMGIYYHTHVGGKFTWIECGCLCDMEPEYMEGKTANWQQGFGIGFYKNNGSGRFNTQLVPIVNGKAMYGGYEFL